MKEPIEVRMELVAHPTHAAMVQAFVNARTGERMLESALIGKKLLTTFPDTMGRLVLVFADVDNH